FVAHASGGPSEAVDQMAMAFVVARALYILTYVADWAMLRTLVWFAGFFLTISIFVSAA
ncbi:MAG: hypothetical protein RL617_967, partial [Pseudomonadota bacterium]